MQELVKIQTKTKLVKYIFLSASLCVLVAVLVILYLHKLPTEDESSFKTAQKEARKLPKEYSLRIKQSIFEGVSTDLAPYVIMAQNVARNTANEYLLKIVNGTYKLADGEIIIKADSGTLNETEKSVTLKDNVSILFNGMSFNSEKMIVNLSTKDAKSPEEVEVTFEQSKIRADQFQTEDSAGIIKFKGNVDSSFDLEN